jgi:hypothetical protein
MTKKVIEITDETVAEEEEKEKIVDDENDVISSSDKPAPKSPAELKEIAMGIYKGEIWTDRHCNSARDVFSCFMVLGLGGKKVAEQMESRKIGLVYEYMSKAGPRAINGMPCFFSCQMLTQNETNEMFIYYKKIKNAMDEIME